MGEDIERKIKIAQLKKASKQLLVRLFILFLLCAIGGFIFRVRQLFELFFHKRSHWP